MSASRRAQYRGPKSLLTSPAFPYCWRFDCAMLPERQRDISSASGSVGVSPHFSIVCFSTALGLSCAFTSALNIDSNTGQKTAWPVGSEPGSNQSLDKSWKGFKTKPILKGTRGKKLCTMINA